MSKVMVIFVKFRPFFTIRAHQIWSCHVTLEENFENFLFCPNFTFNFRKRHKISGGKALYFRSFQPKTSRRAFRVKLVKFLKRGKAPGHDSQ